MFIFFRCLTYWQLPRPECLQMLFWTNAGSKIPHQVIFWIKICSKIFRDLNVCVRIFMHDIRFLCGCDLWPSRLLAAFTRGSRQEYSSTDPSFTMRRKMEHLREEMEQIGLLRQVGNHLQLIPGNHNSVSCSVEWGVKHHSPSGDLGGSAGHMNFEISNKNVNKCGVFNGSCVACQTGGGDSSGNS